MAFSAVVIFPTLLPLCLFRHKYPKLTVCVTYRFHDMSKYGERMGRSLGLEICKKMEIEIVETYHVADYFS